jgi:hypothetical protein
MNDKVGIWIDHKKAVIVFTSMDGVTAKTLESEVGPHARYSGRAGYPTSDDPQDGRGEKKYEERYGQHLDRYYDGVISQLGQPEALLIFGPGGGQAATQGASQPLQGAVWRNCRNWDHGQTDWSANRSEGEGALRDRSLRQFAAAAIDALPS